MLTAELCAEDAAAMLEAALNQAVAGDPWMVARLGQAATSIRFAVGSSEGPGPLLDLTGNAPMVACGGSGEIEFVVPVDDTLAVAHGHVSMLALLTAGLAKATGPARRYLEVDPILQHLLGLSASPSVRDDVRPGYPAASRLDPDLLAIETRGLTKAFGPHVVLDGLDVAIPEGSISVLLGPSGTGKSVLLRHVIGLLEPDAGQVLVRGRSLVGLSDSELLALRCEVGVMFQDGALFSHLNVFDNVAFPLREHTDLDDREVYEVVMRRLSDLGLAGAANRMPAQLSGGMRKRAGLARALVLEPGIILVDEPDSGLDPVRTALLGELLVAQHASNGGTMVIVTHNVPLARFISSHVSVVWKGKVVVDGPADDVFTSDDPFVKQFLARETLGPLGMD